MITCPNCNNKELIGALFCSECGARLDPASSPNSTLAFTKPHEKVRSPSAEPIPLPESDSKLTLFFVEYGSKVNLDEDGEFLVGRASDGPRVSPDVDLTGMDGFRNGVSRRHASIMISARRVEIKDLGSSNGTTLNGRRLTPMVPYGLHTGDELFFGKLQALVILRTQPATA